MSIEQHSVIDFIGVDKNTKEVFLTITDHLDWNNTNDHLWQLQEKINAYIRFIESGEILEKFPEAKDRNIIIEIVGREHYPPVAKEFIDMSNEVLKNVPTQLRFRLFGKGRMLQERVKGQ